MNTLNNSHRIFISFRIFIENTKIKIENNIKTTSFPYPPSIENEPKQQTKGEKKPTPKHKATSHVLYEFTFLKAIFNKVSLSNFHLVTFCHLPVLKNSGKYVPAIG